MAKKDCCYFKSMAKVQKGCRCRNNLKLIDVVKCSLLGTVKDFICDKCGRYKKA